MTLIEIIKYCDDSSVIYFFFCFHIINIKLSSFLPKLYNQNSFQSMIYVGILLENLIIK